MIWFVILVIAYIAAVAMVINTNSKTTQVVVLACWGLLALGLGYFAWGIFG